MRAKDRRSGFIVNGPDATPLPVRICDIRCSPQCAFTEAEANARLIAAAPELLSALSRLAAVIGNSDLTVVRPGEEEALAGFLDAARAAIRKATVA